MVEELVMVPLEELKPAPEFNTRTKGLGDLADLTESIKVKGILVPLLGRRMDNGHVMFHAGYRRYEAAKKLKLKSVPVTVVPRRNKTNRQMLIENVTENVQREGLNPVDEAMALQRLQKEHQMSVDEICGELGLKKSRIQQRFSLLKLATVVRNAVHSDRITLGAAKEISRLPADKQGPYVNKAEDLSTARLAKMVDKELEKIQLGIGGKPPKEPKDTSNAAVTEWVRTIRTRLKGLAEEAKYDPEKVKEVNWRMLDIEDLEALGRCLEACMELIQDTVDIKDKAEEEIIRCAEAGVDGKKLDLEHPAVRSSLKLGMIRYAGEVAIEKASGSGKRPKITFAIVQGVIDQFYS